MKESLRAVVASRIVPVGLIREFQRWSLLDPEIYLGHVHTDALEAARSLNEQLEVISEEYPREADLSARQEYLRNKKPAVLHHPYIDPVPVDCCVLRTGEYLFPTGVVDSVLLDPDAFLLDGTKKVRFVDLRNIYADELLVFVAATPCKEVADG